MKDMVSPGETRESLSRRLSKEGKDAAALEFRINVNISPVEAYAVLRDLDDTGYTFLLESAENEQKSFGEKDEDTSAMEDRGRFSFIGFDPAAKISAGENRIEVENMSSRFNISEKEVEGGKADSDQLDLLRQAMPDLNLSEDKTDRFTGGLVGFHPYDIVYDIKPVESDYDEVPNSIFVFSDKYVVFDHEEESLDLVYLVKSSENVEKAFNKAKSLAEEIAQRFERSERSFSRSLNITGTDFDTKESYEKMVRDVKQHVLEGDIYQGVVSRKKRFEIEGEPLTIYRELRNQNPSPYMYVLEFGAKGVIGASPETLVKVEGEKVTTNPIAGTVGRGDTVIEDRKLEGEMLADEKERSEHVMLVDLGRNDINRVSKPGSVEVERLMEVLQYSTVQHLESIVTGTLREEKDGFDAMRSVFPAGTLSGAPKVRAMRIISQQEEEARGLYGGAVAYYSLNGNMDSAITIRTMMFSRENSSEIEAEVQAGAGIVADSRPEKEFKETNQKMGSITEILNDLDEAGGEE